MKERALVAMSGGVDSSVAALLMKRRGFEVLGAVLLLGTEEDGSARTACGGPAPLWAARASADRIGVPLVVVDARDVFEKRILRPAWEAYASGLTPNPCVLCNERIKFGLLAEKARTLGARWIASGHHARIEEGGSGPRLLRGRDRNKDQSYFLFALPGARLANVRFPVGSLLKDEIRDLAREAALPGADDPESQDACFSNTDHGFAETLRRRFGEPARPGAFIGAGGRRLGRHEGVHRYTVGQRRGLGVALGRRAYVAAIRPERAEVVLDEGGAPPTASGLEASGCRFHVSLRPGDLVEVQIRSRHRAVPARIERLDEDRLRLSFATPQRAVAPGQAAVLYREDRVLGGGWIDRLQEPFAL